MAFTFSEQGNNSVYGTGSVAAAAVNVAADDLIVVSIGTMDVSVWCTGVTDTEGNSYTVRTAVTGVQCALVMAYCLNASANASNVVTATFNNATECRKNIIASAYTPDSGETVTLDVAMNDSSAWEDPPWTTGTDDTTGTDEVCVAGIQAASITFTDQEIPGGTVATALVDNGHGDDGWYRILIATASGLYAQIDADPSNSNYFAMEMLCFKSESTKLGYAFGEESPTEETAESWATWSDGAAGSPEVVGDADWGQLKLEVSEVGQSAVKDLGSVKNRIIVMTKDKYGGSGYGVGKIYIRGQAATFNQDDGSPSWEEYTAPVKKDWRYIQAKLEYST